MKRKKLFQHDNDKLLEKVTRTFQLCLTQHSSCQTRRQIFTLSESNEMKKRESCQYLFTNFLYKSFPHRQTMYTRIYVQKILIEWNQVEGWMANRRHRKWRREESEKKEIQWTKNFLEIPSSLSTTKIFVFKIIGLKIK